MSTDHDSHIRELRAVLNFLLVLDDRTLNDVIKTQAYRVDSDYAIPLRRIVQVLASNPKFGDQANKYLGGGGNQLQATIDFLKACRSNVSAISAQLNELNDTSPIEQSTTSHSQLSQDSDLALGRTFLIKAKEGSLKFREVDKAYPSEAPVSEEDSEAEKKSESEIKFNQKQKSENEIDEDVDKTSRYTPPVDVQKEILIIPPKRPQTNLLESSPIITDANIEEERIVYEDPFDRRNITSRPVPEERLSPQRDISIPNIQRNKGRKIPFFVRRPKVQVKNLGVFNKFIGFIKRNPLLALIIILILLFFIMLINRQNSVFPPYPFPYDISLTPVPPAQVIVIKSGPDSVDNGAEINYQITIKLINPAQADITIKDILPQQTEFRSASDNGINSSGILTWNINGLQSNISKTVSFNVRPTVNDTWITNSVSASINGGVASGNPILADSTFDNLMRGQGRNVNVLGNIDQFVQKVLNNGSKYGLSDKETYIRQIYNVAISKNVNPLAVLSIWGEEQGFQINNLAFGCDPYGGSSPGFNDQLNCSVNTLNYWMQDFETSNINGSLSIPSSPGVTNNCVYTDPFLYAFEWYGPVCHAYDGNDNARSNYVKFYTTLLGNND